MSEDDWEYERPEYAVPAEAETEVEAGAEAQAGDAASAAGSVEAVEAVETVEAAAGVDADADKSTATEQADQPAQADSVEAADQSDVTDATGRAAATDATAAAGATATDTADRTEPAAVGLPAQRTEPKTPLPAPRAESRAESGDADIAGFDDATWQLSTDMAPLPPLRQCLEAILLVVEEPVADVVLAQITERPRDEVLQTLHELSAEYTEQQRGFDLRHVAGGWRLYTRAACAPLVEKFVLDGQQAKLSQPALETLAVVAYRQPVSRSRISAVRGVNCDGVMRTLLTRGLIEEAGTDMDSGAILYRTTGLFLEKMGMQSLEELPELAPLLPSVESMEEAETLG